MRRVFIALALGLMLGLSVPVVADHVSEPTAPLTSVDLQLQEYATHTFIDCDAAVPQQVDFGNLRIEAFARFEGFPGVNPSEHWDLRVRVGEPRFDRNGNMTVDLAWTARWKHQNVPPHANGSKWEIVEANHYDLGDRLGLWVVEVLVTANESGRVFEESCVFERV